MNNYFYAYKKWYNETKIKRKEIMDKEISPELIFPLNSQKKKKKET